MKPLRKILLPAIILLLNQMNVYSQKSFKTDFIPKGYSILDSVRGDLNLDSVDDYIVILKNDKEEKTSDVLKHPEKRPLYILIGQKNKTFKIAAKNDNAVYCFDCGGMLGDPFTGVTIKKGYFSVEHYGGSGWRWTRIVTFKYSKVNNNWFLYKDGSDSFNVSNTEKVKSKVLTSKNFGNVLFTKFNIYKD